MASNFLRGSRSLGGQSFHLCGHHGEPATSLAGTGRLDRRVQRKQIGLGGNLGDHVGDCPDALDLLVEHLDGGASLGPGGHSPADHGGGPADLTTDLADRGGELLGRAGDSLRIGQSLRRGSRRSILCRSAG